jgi:hypothetical protein
MVNPGCTSFYHFKVFVGYSSNSSILFWIISIRRVHMRQVKKHTNASSGSNTKAVVIVRVKVEIFDIGGALLEEGDAVSDDAARNLWKYIAQALNPAVSGTIRVTAFDKPGNTGTLEQVI